MSHNPGSTHDLSIQAPNLHTARLFCHFQTNFCKRKQHFRQTSAKSCWKLNVSWESPSGWNNLWLPIQNILGAWGQPGMPVQVLTKKWRGGNSQIAQHQKKSSKSVPRSQTRAFRHIPLSLFCLQTWHNWRHKACVTPWAWHRYALLTATHNSQVYPELSAPGMLHFPEGARMPSDQPLLSGAMVKTQIFT